MTEKDNPRVFVPPPLIFVGLLSFGLLVERAPFALQPIQLAAIVAGLAGLALIAAALSLFRNKHTRAEPWQPSSALVTNGVYRFTRNPMYLGMAIVCLAVALFSQSLAAGLLTLAAVVIIDRTVIAREEAYLVRRFGDDFVAYRRRVHRWL